MPDEYGNLKPISVPMVPWLQTFEPGQRVRITATQQLGTVENQSSDSTVWTRLDDAVLQNYFPGELRPA